MLKESLDIYGDDMHEECGVFGIFGVKDAANLAYYGLHALQHRGQEACGISAADEDGNIVSGDHLYMHGSNVFNFTADVVPNMVEKLLVKSGLQQDDVNLWVFHQANKYMINYLRKLLDIDKDKFYIFMEKVGNTVSSTIPIALCEARKEDRLHGNVLLAGFGVGLSWGGVMIRIK
mgnify:CR=1 FL=1